MARRGEIGGKHYINASAGRAIEAQRLVRKLCADCKTPSSLSDHDLRALGLEAAQMADASIYGPAAGSYTHLTLPRTLRGIGWSAAL